VLEKARVGSPKGAGVRGLAVHQKRQRQLCPKPLKGLPSWGALGSDVLFVGSALRCYCQMWQMHMSDCKSVSVAFSAVCRGGDVDVTGTAMHAPPDSTVK
jgi:hypothetical protein